MNLTRVTFPPQMPSNPPHHRSGAALYSISLGLGPIRSTASRRRGAGSLVYEPYDLVHQWGNPGSEPFTFLAFNINPEDVAAMLPAAPPKERRTRLGGSPHTRPSTLHQVNPTLLWTGRRCSLIYPSNEVGRGRFAIVTRSPSRAASVCRSRPSCGTQTPLGS